MAIHRYTIFVRIVKILCNVVVLSALLLLIIFINIESTHSIKLQNNNKHGTENLPTTTTVGNASFFGYDLRNKEYNLHAKQTLQLNQDLYKFIDIQMQYYMDVENKTYVSAIADEAMADSHLKYIKLIKNVELIYSGGYRVLTEKIDINFNDMYATSILPTIATGNQGKIIANSGFILKDTESTVEFFGPVTTILY